MRIRARHVGLLVGGLTCILVGPEDSGVVECQGSCVNTAENVTNPASLEPFLESTTGCIDYDDPTLPISSILWDGTFVKAAVSNISQGARASTTGQCVVQWMFQGQCYRPPYSPVPRNIQYVLLGMNPPGQPQNFYLQNKIGYTIVYQQSIDSSMPGTTTGPKIRSATLEATYTFNYWVRTDPTVCNIQLTNHPEQTRTINVTACKPEWLFYQGQNLRAPLPNLIKVHIPLGMEEALGPATDAAAALGPLLNIDFDVRPAPFPTQPCLGEGGNCVSINDQFIYDFSRPGCADLLGGQRDPSGVYESPSQIRLMANVWRTADVTRLRRLIAHELLHYFGLQNRLEPGCTSGNTIMGAENCDVAYSSQPVPDGELIGASASDVGSVNTGTYGPMNRKFCGW